MVRKEVWKGIEEENIDKVPLDEFYKKTTSRNRRTLKRLKNNPKLKKFMEEVAKIKKDNPKKLIKTHMRDAIIIPEWVGLTFGIYNGKEFRSIEMTTHMVGKRLGDFAHSTGRVLHSGPGVGATRGSKFVPLK